MSVYLYCALYHVQNFGPHACKVNLLKICLFSGMAVSSVREIFRAVKLITTKEFV